MVLSDKYCSEVLLLNRASQVTSMTSEVYKSHNPNKLIIGKNHDHSAVTTMQMMYRSHISSN